MPMNEELIESPFHFYFYSYVSHEKCRMLTALSMLWEPNVRNIRRDAFFFFNGNIRRDVSREILGEGYWRY